MIVLGIDPGATTGLAVMEVPIVGRPKWLWHGCTRDTSDPVAWAIGEASKALGAKLDLDAVAIEWIEGYVYEQQRGADIIRTARLEGMFARDAQAAGWEPVQVSRKAWRKALCRNGSVSDAIVKRALELQTIGMPKRTNCHARDAAGVAIVGARMARAMGRKTA